MRQHECAVSVRTAVGTPFARIPAETRRAEVAGTCSAKFRSCIRVACVARTCSCVILACTAGHAGAGMVRRNLLDCADAQSSQKAHDHQKEKEHSFGTEQSGSRQNPSQKAGSQVCQVLVASPAQINKITRRPEGNRTK